MCSAKEHFEKLIETGELREYLLDAFDRYSHAHHADMDELEHAMEIKLDVERALAEHKSNKTVSHEMWAIAALISQFQRAADKTARAPTMLGEHIYNHPAFAETFTELRAMMRNSPQLERA